MAYSSPSRRGRASFLDSLLHTPTYRAVVIGLLVFCACVGGGAWLLAGPARPHQLTVLSPPGALYHVRPNGDMVPVGGSLDATKPPAAPVPAALPHADLLDHQYHISAEFGHYPDGGPHFGLDLDAWTGTVIHAPVAGTVTEVQRGCTVGDLSCGKGWGDHVWFQSSETGHYILVAHFSQLNDWVQVGTTFDAGAPFGLSGSTGYSSGPHVHLQVNPTQMANPGSTQPAWEFPWLHCGEPVLGALFGAGCS